MNKLQPSTLTIRYLNKHGWKADICERMVGGRIRHDLYGFGDVQAFNDRCILIVQATSVAHVKDRTDKLLKIDAVTDWIVNPSREVSVWGWDYRDGQVRCRVIALELIGGLLVARNKGDTMFNPSEFKI